MPYRITDGCVACGDCLVVCPEKAILDGYLGGTSAAYRAAAGVVQDGVSEKPWGCWTEFYRITGRCTGCGRCREVCPTGAILEAP